MRILAVAAGIVLGGYWLSAQAVALAGAALARLGMARSEAVVLASMLGFVVYLALLLLAFGMRGRVRGWLARAAGVPGMAATASAKALAWLHSWSGVALGGVLFAIFWSGTLCVFDREIDRWMMPATRLPAVVALPSLDRIAGAVAPAVPAGASQWRVDLPTARAPVLDLSYRIGDKEGPERQFDPLGLAVLPEPGTLGATGFIRPFHYDLHVGWQGVGKWVAGLAGMAMLVLLVSGVIIHKKILAQMFTFRPHKSLQRASLDLHNLTGVLVLPFHFMITLSGLCIFITNHFPQAYTGAYGEDKAARSAFMAEAYGKFARPASGLPGAMASLDAMAARAEREWQGGRPYFVRVWHPGDARGYVELRRSYAADVTMNLDQIYFDAASGRVLRRFQAAPVMTVQRFLSGLHFIQFEHWPLRWLYFGAGLAGCILIATGFLSWLEARRARHARLGLAGVRVVEGIAVGSVTGIVVATLALFAANRGLAWFATPLAERATSEVSIFFLAWAACFAHGWWRGAAAWREQAAAVALLCAACVMLNAITTGDHILRAASRGMWAVAGMDAMLTLLALVAALAWHRLRAGARRA